MKKQSIILSGLIGIVSIVMLIVMSFYMPEKPSYVITNGVPKQNVDKSTQYSGIVVIDPGHGGYDIGAKSNDGSIVEKVYDLEISLKIRDILVEHGVQVIMTRDSDQVSWPTDNGKDLQARLDIAKNANADLMVSIHCNKSDVDVNNVKGSEVYVNMDQKKSVALAESIVGELDKIDSLLESRGIKTGTLHLTIFNEVPTVIVEMGYLSNNKDVEFLNNDVCLDILVRVIVNGILNQLEPMN